MSNWSDMTALDRRIITFISGVLNITIACFWTWLGMLLGFVRTGFYEYAFYTFVICALFDGLYLYRTYRKQKKARSTR